VVDTTAVVELIHHRTQKTNRTNVYPLAALTLGLQGEQLAEMDTLKRAGCIGVSNALAPIENTEVLRRAFEYAHSCNLTVFFFAEDNSLKNNGVAHEGHVSTRLGSKLLKNKACRLLRMLLYAICILPIWTLQITIAIVTCCHPYVANVTVKA
jgi:dihydroorotase-like cyclic amidohydrolase